MTAKGRITAARITSGTWILVDNLGDIRGDGKNRLIPTTRTRTGKSDNGTVTAVEVTRTTRGQATAVGFNRRATNSVFLTTRLGVVEAAPAQTFSLAKEADIEHEQAGIEHAKRLEQAEAERLERQASTGLCEFALEPLWRDEDIALAEPRLLAIKTCQRQPGHEATSCHSARTEQEVADIERSLDRANLERSLTALSCQRRSGETAATLRKRDASIAELERRIAELDGPRVIKPRQVNVELRRRFAADPQIGIDEGKIINIDDVPGGIVLDLDNGTSIHLGVETYRR